MAKVPFKPAGFHAVTPYLVVRDVPRLIEFLTQAFGAVEIERSTLGDGTVNHAEVRIDDAVVMMGAARGEWEPTSTTLYLYVPDVDAAYHSALQAGATSVREPANQFYGDRSGGVKDPQGNQWWVATHVEDVPPDEMRKRAAAQQSH